MKMHILVITPGFPENENDTDCIPAMQKYFDCLVLNYPSVKISVIAIHYPYSRGNYNWKTINVFSCGGRRLAQPFRLIYWIKALYYALKINKENKIDIIHSFWLNESALIGNIVSRIINKKHVNTLMGQDAGGNNKYPGFLSLGRIIKVAVSEFQSKMFLVSSGTPVEQIINWGTEDVKIQKDQRIYDVVGVGALIPLKNYKLFINIISDLVKEFPGIKCLLIGDGIEKKAIINEINKNGLSDNIILTGHIKREDVLRRLGQSKILLHTSYYEAFGYVIAEALASGCFVVSRKTGCADKSDKIKIAENKNEFVESIKKLLKTDLDYRPYRPFKVEDTAEKYYELYNNLSLP